MTDDDLFGVDLSLIGDVAAVASAIYLHDLAPFWRWRNWPTGYINLPVAWEWVIRSDADSAHIFAPEGIQAAGDDQQYPKQGDLQYH